MRKYILVIALIIAIIIPFQSYATAESKDVINELNWNKAVMYLGWNNNTLLNMSESVRIAKREYEQAAERAEDIETEGMTIEIMGREVFIEYNYYTKMMMTQQKELMPEQMKLAWEMNRDSWNATRNSLVIGLRNYYLGLYNAYSTNNLKMRSYELAKSIHNQNVLKFEKGMITDIDVADSEFALLKAKVDADAAKRNYENTLRSFNSYVGLSLEEKFDNVICDEKFDKDRLKGYEYYLNKALKSRLDIISLQKQLNLMEKKREIMDRYPLSLNTVVAREDYNDNLVNIETATKKLEAVKLNIEKEIRDLYIEAVSAGRNTSNMKKLLDLQKSNLDKMKRKFELGMISKIMMDQAQLSYDEFESNYKAVLFDYNTKLMKLEFASSIGLAF